MSERPSSPYLVTKDVAEYMRVSTRTVAELTRRNLIPHRILPGTRRCLYLPAELAAWADGAELEGYTLPYGGKRVKPSGFA